MKKRYIVIALVLLIVIAASLYGHHRYTLMRQPEPLISNPEHILGDIYITLGNDGTPIEGYDQKKIVDYLGSCSKKWQKNITGGSFGTGDTVVKIVIFEYAQHHKSYMIFLGDPNFVV